jgi:hypothetical protein
VSVLDRIGSARASGGGKTVALFAGTAVAVVVLTTAVLSGGPRVAVLVLIAAFGSAAVIAALLRKPVMLIGLLVVASAAQRAVAASTQNSTALWLDDIVLVGIILYVAIKVLESSSARTKVAIAILVLVLLFALVRAPQLDLGINQLRQMAVPMVLLLFGMVLTKDQLMRAAPIVVVVIMIGAIYGLFEQLGLRPIDPLGVLGLNQFSHGGFRNGLPNSYFYYFSDGVRLERSGGLILNPPSFGMLVAAGLIWAWFSRKNSPFLVVISTILFVVAAFYAFGRGGFVLLALAVFQPFLTRKSGKLSFLVVGVVLGYIALSEFVGDGESSRHVDGFFGGIMYAITHPLGGGFGTAGNSLSQLGIQNESGANESLAAIFMASTGWIGIIVVAALLIRGVLSGATFAGVALTGAILVSLVSETAGGLDATGPLWILAGFALSPVSRPEPGLTPGSEAESPAPAHSTSPPRRIDKKIGFSN